MRHGISEPGSLADLSARFVRRQAIEAEHHKGRRAYGRGDFFLRHDDILRPILRWSLKAAGLYAAGLHAARQPLVRSLCFEFDSLPAAFHGFRILHLSDLHRAIVEKNADKIRGRTNIRMIVGDNDGLMARNQWFHELLTRLNIQHQFVISKGAIHNLREELSRLDSNPFEFYAKAFAHAK